MPPADASEMRRGKNAVHHTNLVCQKSEVTEFILTDAECMSEALAAALREDKQRMGVRSFDTRSVRF